MAQANMAHQMCDIIKRYLVLLWHLRWSYRLRGGLGLGFGTWPSGKGGLW